MHATTSIFLFLFCLHLPRLPILISTDIVSINQVNRFNRFPFVSRWRLKVESVDLVVLKRIDPHNPKYKNIKT